MKKADNNEMDLVLRSLAKSRRDESALGFGSAVGDYRGEMAEHLDADELITFAEGLVPELARARFTEHLADCASCRGTVVSLAQASGIASPSLTAKNESHPGFWQKLAALFSPQVWRYAVPALTLTAVIAVSFLALRQRSGREFVVEHYGAPATTESELRTKEQPLETSGKQTPSVPKTRPDLNESIDSTRERSKSQSDRDEIAKSTANTDLAAAAPGLKDSSLPPPPAASSDAARPQPSFAPEPKAGALASGRPIVSEVDKKVEVQKEEQPAERAAQQRGRDEYKVDASKNAEDKSSGLYTNAPSGPRRADGTMTERRANSVKNKRESSGEEETRAVSGRRFRRQGNVWIDTSYQSSRTTINVSRGSEQFRALVADEPEIRTVANQLAGEVIVVWKGKAYRIR
ncbi:MAG: hypothetical protein AABN95_00210 [Acidobacteriota bacterium]